MTFSNIYYYEKERCDEISPRVFMTMSKTKYTDPKTKNSVKIALITRPGFVKAH